MMTGIGRRLHIVHRTGYRYAEVVDASFNEVRMTPLTVGGQLLLNHTLTVHPGSSVQTYEDYWGAHVEAFDVHGPHLVLEIAAISTVDTPPMTRPAPKAISPPARNTANAPALLAKFMALA